MAVSFKGNDEEKEKRTIRDRYIREMVCDVFDVVLVYNGTLIEINSIHRS